MDLDPVRMKVVKLLMDRSPPTDMKNASIAMGRNAAYLHQFVYRGTPKVLSEDDREALAEHLGCESHELKHTKKPPRKPRRKTVRSQIHIAPSSQMMAPEGHSAIREIDVRASAGPGALNDEIEETKEMWFFPDPVIKHEFRASPSDLRMITIDGDSMMPLLSNGDRIMIDTSQKIPVPPGIFVIWDGMGVVAKRVEHKPQSDPPKVVIKSVNPEYESYERDAEEVRIIGRVVWSGRRL